MPATVVERRARANRSPRSGVAHQQFLHEEPCLEPGQAPAEADVLTEAERKVHGLTGRRTSKTDASSPKTRSSRLAEA